MTTRADPKPEAFATLMRAYRAICLETEVEAVILFRDGDRVSLIETHVARVQPIIDAAKLRRGRSR